MIVSQDPQNSEAMETDDENVSTKEILIFMEFDKKMKDYLFDNKIFFRMARLEESPLIQINNHIFKGEYMSCTGTNLFFSDYEKQKPENILGVAGSIKLKHVATQFKTLILKPVKIPSNMADLPQPLHDIEINVNYDNKTLLKKFAYGTLNLKEDLVVVPRRKASESVNVETTPVISERDKRQEGYRDEPKFIISSKSEQFQQPINTKSYNQLSVLNKLGFSTTNSQKTEVIVDILTHKFEKLKKLAMRPTRRKKESEPIAECEEKYRKAYDYNCLKSAIMKPSDYFRTINENFNEKTLVGAVDIDRSIIQGVIDPSPQLYRVLSEEEKVALLSIKNLENLSMIARYEVMKSHLEHLTSSVAILCSDKEFERDAFGRTIKETIKIYKRLLRVIGGIVKQKYCYDSDVEDNL